MSFLGLKNRENMCQKEDAFGGSRMDTSFEKLIDSHQHLLHFLLVSGDTCFMQIASDHLMTDFYDENCSKIYH